MTPRDDGDAQATRHRSVRRKEGRGRQAGRLLSRAGWLDAPLAFWTGERQADEIVDLPRLLQVVAATRGEPAATPR